MTTIVVAAAVIERNGRFLVTRRQPGVHLEGHWEFPGGKCEPGETLSRCVARELGEELSVSVRVGAEVLVTAHDYPDRRVELHFLRCEIEGDPAPQLGQDMCWATPKELAALDFAPADAELIRLLARSEV